MKPRYDEDDDSVATFWIILAILGVAVLLMFSIVAWAGNAANGFSLPGLGG